MNNIIPVYDIGDLGKTIADYDTIVKTKNSGESSNNKKFNDNLQKIVDNLLN
ncbi:Conserved domain protein [Lactobacillus equicursoris 66c]|uniref:Conserved domain protein n=1 Tax=Lactobacillus equicursoris 66c TaxID=872326 RepID=K0NV58_9LACO|nr:Conserved domain protein [Lactobacillus equicursoris 66c]